MSAILQCLVNCQPLQTYFLREVGHHYKSCQIYRNNKQRQINESTTLIKVQAISGKDGAKTATTENIESECLASEMDRLFLSYYGSTIGKDLFQAIEESSCNLFQDNMNNKCAAKQMNLMVGDDDGKESIKKGEPLIISDLLKATWRSGGMNHLAGYEQRDAHEFLNSFLETMGKHSKQHRDRVVASINTATDANWTLPEHKQGTKSAESGEILFILIYYFCHFILLIFQLSPTFTDIVEQLFEGTLRSVFLCEECGEKRMLHEPFMNISLTLSEEVESLERESNNNNNNAPSAGSGKNEKITKLSVQKCLEHFILPEKLGDPIDCPNCAKRTSTRKQHTFAKLPKVLCLHLKRFDAARNKKIDDFVSFPAKGLNMGPLLSHWYAHSMKSLS
jgi:ubiquitin C-terminal hydrolase